MTREYVSLSLSFVVLCCVIGVEPSVPVHLRNHGGPELLELDIWSSDLIRPDHVSVY